MRAEALEVGDEAAIQRSIEAVGGIQRFDLTQTEIEAIGWANSVCEPA